MSAAVMTSRERVVRAIHHREPDRVPFDLTLTVDVHDRLRRALRLPAEPQKAVGRWTEVAASLDLLEAMGTDFYHVHLNPPSRRKIAPPPDGLLYDEWGIGRAKVARADGGYYYEIVHSPLRGAGVRDIERYPWPDPFDPGRVAGLREKVRRAEQTGRAIFARFASSIWELAWYLYGLEDWLVDLVARPDVATALLTKLCDLAIGFTQAGLEAVGEKVDIFRFGGEDLGTQVGPMISEPLFVEMVLPHYRRHWSFTRKLLREKNPAAKIQVHSCGNVRPFIPYWIELGLDILEPIQPYIPGMEPERLKRDFGDRLAFYGGIDLQHLLPFGTRRQVMEGVRRHIEALGPGGGYIVAPAHFVQSDVPPENLIAVRDAVERFGRYPLRAHSAQE